MKVSDIMDEVLSVDKDISLVEVAKILSRERVSSIVYIKKGHAEGIITEKDVVKNAEHLKKKTLSQVMSKRLVTINYDKDIEDALEVMKRKKVKRILVVDEKDTLIGIITATDIIANYDLINKSFFSFI